VNLFHSGIFIFSMKNMFINVIQIQAFEKLVFTRIKSKTPPPTVLVVIWPTEATILGNRVRLGALEYTSVKWLALRYTVMRYLIHFCIRNSGVKYVYWSLRHAVGFLNLRTRDNSRLADVQAHSLGQRIHGQTLITELLCKSTHLML